MQILTKMTIYDLNVWSCGCHATLKGFLYKTSLDNMQILSRLSIFAVLEYTSSLEWMVRSVSRLYIYTTYKSNFDPDGLIAKLDNFSVRHL